ncbi:MAG: hypothetical protein U9N59_04505 [Campylobacterota bacterium]|nr:hypothetical protein [Campylobacterota bacterium]
MAYDLSILIQDGLCNTLENLLGADTKLNGITKVDERDLQNLELLKIESEFVFEQISTVFSFIVPASSASLIFNIQMGDTQTEPATHVDDDTTDAISEFISTVSGGLTTAINGAEIEELGKAKFHITGDEILQGDSITDIDNMYRFSINIDDNEIIIFILFNESILPYIYDITMKPVTEHSEEVEEIKIEDVEEEIIEESLPNDTESEKEVVTQELENEGEQKEEDESEDNIDDKPENKKLKMLVMGTAALLGVTIIAGIIMYFMGVFDPEPMPVKKVESNTTKATKDIVSIVKYKSLKKVDFKISDINTPRLNIRLEALTKYKILTSEEIEDQALAEKNRLFEIDKEKKLMEFAKKNKEEVLTNTTTTQKVIKNKSKSDIEDKNLKFLVTNSIKYKFFKDIILKTKTNQARISICNDKDGRTTIFIGPLENNKLQLEMKNLIQEGDKNIKTTISNITQEEFDIRCNF